MSFVTLFLTALGLSADCFAVSVGASLSATARSRWAAFRMALSFGVFQALMLAAGWLAGRTVVDVIGKYDHWVAFGLLSLVGAKMLWESFHERSSESAENEGSATKGLMLLTLSFATSIDALAVGLSFAFLQVNVLQASLTIGTVAFGVTALGFFIGRRVGRMLGRRAEAAGGLVLIGIGLRTLLEHLLS